MEVEANFNIVNEGRDEVPANVDFSPNELLSLPKILKATETPQKHVSVRAVGAAHGRAEDFFAPAALHADQYFHIYSERTKKIKPAIKDRVKAGFCSDSKATVDMIVDKILHTKMGEHCILVGTLYKDMPLKPSVLKEYSEERSVSAILIFVDNIGPVPSRQSFVSEKDALVLEDETGRIKLVGVPAEAAPFVTGVVVGVRGVQLDSGDFEVREILIPHMPPQAPIQSGVQSEGPRYVVLASGLNVGSSQQNPMFPQLFADYIGGLVCSPTEQSEFVASFVRLVSVPLTDISVTDFSLSPHVLFHVCCAFQQIIAGNTFCREDEQPNAAKLRDPNKKLTREEQSKAVVAIQLLDLLLKDLGQQIPVDVMPGPNDPSDYSLPQQPINKFFAAQRGE